MIQESDYHQSEKGYQPVPPGAVIRAAHASGHIVDGRGVQGKANGKYNGSGNQRRE